MLGSLRGWLECPQKGGGWEDTVAQGRGVYQELTSLAISLSLSVSI